jgi:cell division septation protein DedD
MAENRRERGPTRYYFTRGQLVLLGSGFTLTSIVIFLLGTLIGQKIEENKLLKRSETPLVKIPAQLSSSEPARSSVPGDEVAVSETLSKEAAKSSPSRKSTNLPVADAKAEEKVKAKKAVVKSEAVLEPEKTEAKAESASPGEWTVQVNAFPHERDAKDLAKKLTERGYDAYVVPVEVKGKTWYRVRAGRLATREQAKELQETMRDKEGLGKAIAVSR